MPDKHTAARRVGGPGAAHENRQAPGKSRPHGTLDRNDARSGARREQNKPWGEAGPFDSDSERGHAEVAATRGKQHAAPAADRSRSNAGDTAADTDLIHPRDRRQVR
jgi:hypothetical protein